MKFIAPSIIIVLCDLFELWPKTKTQTYNRISILNFTHTRTHANIIQRKVINCQYEEHIVHQVLFIQKYSFNTIRIVHFLLTAIHHHSEYPATQ